MKTSGERLSELKTLASSLALAATVVVTVALPGCSGTRGQPESGSGELTLSVQEMQALDSLDATDTVRYFLSTTDADVVYYLRSSEMRGANRSPSETHVWGASEVTFNGVKPDSCEPDRLEFYVTFSTDSTQGPETAYVIVTQEDPNGVWRVASMGAMP